MQLDNPNYFISSWKLVSPSKIDDSKYVSKRYKIMLIKGIIAYFKLRYFR